MNKRLRELMESVETWPEAAQQEAIAFLESIAGYVALGPSDDDRLANERNEGDVRSGNSREAIN
jgi:hypothetical protein